MIPEFHIVSILPPLAVPLPCPALALGVLVHAGLGRAPLACLHSQDQVGGWWLVSYLSTVDIHILCILRALPCLCPLLAVHVVILTSNSTLLTGHGAVHQHPAGVGLALVHAGPGGTVPCSHNCLGKASKKNVKPGLLAEVRGEGSEGVLRIGPKIEV